MPAMNSRLAVSVAVAAAIALSGCQKAADKPAAAAPVWKLDESQLIQPFGFTAADLDTSKNACTDLAANANDKWLAANPIPADKTSWGAFQY